MRKYLLIVVLLLIFPLSFNFSEEIYSGLTSEINAMAFIKDTQISEKDDHLYIQMNTTFQDEKMIYYYQDIFEKAYLEVPSKSITLLIYSEGFPLLRIQSLQEDIENYINGKTERNAFIEKMVIKDIRSIEHVLYDELNLFDAYIIGISVDQSKTTVQLESMKPPEEFQDDFMAMALTVIENTPWVNEVVFQFFKDEELIITIKGYKDDFLMTMKGTISEENFVEFLVFEIPADDKKLNGENETDKIIDNGQDKTLLDKDYPIINVASGKINEVINGRKIFKLEVPESIEYYIRLKHLDVIKTEIRVKDENMNTIDDNFMDEGLEDYLYVDLEGGKDYYLEVKVLEDLEEAVDITIEAASSIFPFIIGILVILAGIGFGIFKILKKIKK